jgi:rhodanese-related sulfurtransferase
MTRATMRSQRAAVSQTLWGDLLSEFDEPLERLQYDWGTTQPFRLPEVIAGECDNRATGIASTFRAGARWDISAATASRWMAEGVAQVVDVREIVEFLGAHIPGARCRSVPSWEPETEDGIQVVVTCRSGRRSREAVAWLRNRGWTAVYSLAGGLLGWMREGRPIELGPGAEENVHIR